MRDKIIRLEAEAIRFNDELQSWKMRCDTLDRIADYERKEKEAALAELSYLRNGVQTTGTDAVLLPPRRPRNQEPQVLGAQQYAAPYVPLEQPEEPLGCGGCTSTSDCACVEQAMAISTSGCGKCTVDTHCECLEETIKAAAGIPTLLELKRSHSPSTNDYAEKRQRQSDPTTPLEMDFTAQFSSKPALHQIQPSQDAHLCTKPPAESCGFCEHGTYCVCAETAATTNANANNEREQHNRLAPLLNEVTPPPSDTDVDSITKPAPMHPNQMHRPVPSMTTQNSCFNGPGTCQQCQNDPRSGLFCRSLAAIRASDTPNSSAPEGCCRGNAGGEGCCKSLPAATPTKPPPSLSCADAYKTLSTHKNFDQASDELSTWLGRLHATPLHHVGRAPIEVEAASVMGVLKLFDRRFGRG